MSGRLEKNKIQAALHEALQKMDFSAVEQRAIDQIATEQRDAESLGYPIAASELLDLHKMKAAVIFGCLYDEVTKEQRAEGKSRNFWNLYSTEPQPCISEVQFKRIYTASQLKQLAIDLGWCASSGVSLYDTLNNRFRIGETPR